MADLAGAGVQDLGDWKRRISVLERELAYVRTMQATIKNAEYPDGVIPPSALARSTAEPGLVSLTDTGFAITSAHTVLVSAQVAVPLGYSSCVVNLLGRVYAINSTGAAGYLTAQAGINTITGNAVPVDAGAAGQPDDAALNLAPVAAVLEGLDPGEVFTVQLAAWTDGGTWAADPSNLLDLTGSIVWFA